MQFLFSPKEKHPLNFLPTSNQPCGSFLTRRYSSLPKIFMLPPQGRVFCCSCLQSSCASSLSRAASLPSTAGWRGRRDFFFEPFLLYPSYSFSGSWKLCPRLLPKQGALAKEDLLAPGEHLLAPSSCSHSQAISLEQGLITIQLSGRHRRERERPGNKVDRRMLTKRLPDLNRAGLICLQQRRRPLASRSKAGLWWVIPATEIGVLKRHMAPGLLSTSRSKWGRELCLGTPSTLAGQTKHNSFSHYSRLGNRYEAANIYIYFLYSPVFFHLQTLVSFGGRIQKGQDLQGLNITISLFILHWRKELSSLFAQQEDNSISMSDNKHLRLFLSSC